MRAKEWVTTSWWCSAKYSVSHRAMRAVIHTASSKARAPAWTAAAFPPKLAPAQATGGASMVRSDHWASARQLTRKATWAYSE